MAQLNSHRNGWQESTPGRLAFGYGSIAAVFWQGQGNSVKQTKESSLIGCIVIFTDMGFAS
jgi:hypothetical protein